CNLLQAAGYELVCVTAIPEKFVQARLENLQKHGFPIDRVIGKPAHLTYENLPTNHGAVEDFVNPKKEIIERLRPVAFVDDQRRNFKDIECDDTIFVYIDGEHTDDHPNFNDDTAYHVKYGSLIEFVKDFLRHDNKMLS
ncbi:unnamed protein product, partial [Didymodactylos carnosus]